MEQVKSLDTNGARQVSLQIWEIFDFNFILTKSIYKSFTQYNSSAFVKNLPNINSRLLFNKVLCT